jgi:hypothetical protein
VDFISYLQLCSGSSYEHDAIGTTEKSARTRRAFRTFQGKVQAFQASLSSKAALIAAALIIVCIILGTLYESFIHPLTIPSTLLWPVLACCWRCMAQRREAPHKSEKRRGCASFGRNRINARPHATALLDNGAQIGAGAKIWHFSHLSGQAQ